MTSKILQWNIWNKENPQNIIKVLKELHPDIFCLQELNSKIAKDISEELGGINYYYHNAQEWPDRSQGNAIFSKFPIKNTQFSYVQNPAMGETNHHTQGRVYLEAEVTFGANVLTVATTHLSHEPTFVDSPIKLEELAKLEALIQSKKSNFIFAADLNASPSSEIIKTLSKYLANLGPDLSLPTWDTKPKSETDKNKLAWRLDYIFGSQDIKVKSSEIVKTQYSDHLPILVEPDF